MSSFGKTPRFRDITNITPGPGAYDAKELASQGGKVIVSKEDRFKLEVSKKQAVGVGPCPRCDNANSKVRELEATVRELREFLKRSEKREGELERQVRHLKDDVSSLETARLAEIQERASLEAKAASHLKEIQNLRKSHDVVKKELQRVEKLGQKMDVKEQEFTKMQRTIEEYQETERTLKDHLENVLETYETLSERLKAKNTEWQEEIMDAQIYTAQAENRAAVAELQVAELSSSMNNQTAVINTLRHDLAMAESRVVEGNKGLRRLEQALVDANNRNDEQKARNTVLTERMDKMNIMLNQMEELKMRFQEQQNVMETNRRNLEKINTLANARDEALSEAQAEIEHFREQFMAANNMILKSQETFNNDTFVLEGDIMNLKDLIAKVMEQSNEVNEKFENRGQELLSLQTESDEYLRTIQETKERLIAKDNDIETLQSRVASLESMCKEHLEALAETEDKAKKTEDILKDEIESRQVHQQTASSLNSKVSFLEGVVADKENAIIDMDVKLQKVTKQATAATEKLGTLEQQNKSYLEEAMTKEQQYKDMKTKYDDRCKNSMSIDEHQNILSGMIESNSNYDRENSRLRSENTMLMDEIRSLQNQYGLTTQDYSAEVNKLRERSEMAWQELSKVQSHAASLAGHHNSRQKIQYVMSLKEENVKLKKELFDLKREHARLRKRTHGVRITS
eukprot:Clim_evm63s152 gene=Clim_evmTU63s152